MGYLTASSGAAITMSRRVKKPLRPAGDRPKGARPYRGSAAERPQSYRPGGKPPARFPGLSFSHIQRIVRKGELRVNGKRADSKDRLEEGQSVRIPPLKLDTPK